MTRNFCSQLEGSSNMRRLGPGERMLANKDVTFCCYMDRFVCCSGCPRLKFWKRLGNLVYVLSDLRG